MTTHPLANARAICDAATKGPWRNGADPSHFDSPEVTDDKTFSYYVTTDVDAAFIAFARSALPAALDRIEELGAERDAAVSARRFAEGQRDDLVVTLRGMNDVSDERDAAVRERDCVQQVLAAMKDVTPEDVVAAVAENDRLTRVMSEAINKWQADAKAVVKMSGCEWCDEMWFKLDGSTKDEIRDVALGHVEKCKANPVRIERDRLRKANAAMAARLELVRDNHDNLLARCAKDERERIAAWLERREEVAARAGTTAEDYLINVAHAIRSNAHATDEEKCR